jgi:hypothetical protein
MLRAGLVRRMSALRQDCYMAGMAGISGLIAPQKIWGCCPAFSCQQMIESVIASGNCRYGAASV